MISAVLAALCWAQPPIAQPPRLRATLPNGIGILVERMPEARQISVHLLATSPLTFENSKTHGLRHLLEHLMARGPEGDLDARLERKGLLLLAETTRDVLSFEITGDPKELDLALESVRQLMSPPRLTAEMILGEIEIMAEELALEPQNSKLASAAWQQAYGGQMPDPLGSLSVMRQASPEALAGLHQALFQEGNRVISISGPFALQPTMDKVRGVFDGLRKPLNQPFDAAHVPFQPGTLTVPISGAARGAGVPPLSARETLYAIAFALAVAQTDPGVEVLYTPSLRSGLVVLTAASSPRLDEAIDGLKEDQVASLYPLGQSLALGWLRGATQDPSRNAKIRGLLMLIRRPLRLEDLIQSLEGMTLDDFKTARERFLRDRAVRVNG